MPVTKIHCSSRPRGKGSFEVMTMEKCLECVETGENPCQLTAPLIRLIHQTWRDSKERSPYSASKVGSCPRKTVLEQKYEWGADPISTIPAIRGTMFHDMFEKYVDSTKNETAEIRFEKEFAGVKITGRFDFIDLNTQTLYDYKSVGKLPAFQYAYIKHKVQGNIYRWLTKGKKVGDTVIDIQNIKIFYLSMDGWKIGKAKLMDMAEVEQEIERYIKAVKPALEAEDDDWKEMLPPVLPYDNWECGYCDLKKVCYTLKDQQLMMDALEDTHDDDTF